MNMEDKRAYYIENLLQNEKFLCWCRKPTPELEEYWRRRISECPGLEKIITEAKLFLSVISQNEAVLASTEMNGMWKHIENQTVPRGHKRKWLLYTRVAAGLLLLITVSCFLLFRDNAASSSGIELVGRPDGEVTDIQLIFSDNKIETIEGKEIEVRYDVNGRIKVNSEKIDSVFSEEIKASLQQQMPQYNQLVVPLGKRSAIVFADGTKIWVNAGSRVVYPVDFTKDKREIFVEGEVFLEVAKNENWPFCVKTNKFEVNVLGTSFNVSAYENESNPSVVLVTGKVNIQTKGQREINLTPSDMFVYDSDKSYVRLVDVYDYIAWKDGLYRFESARLTTILERIARYYGTKFKIDPQLEEITCSGKLDLKDDLNELLEGLTKTVPVQYQFINDTICVTPL